MMREHEHQSHGWQIAFWTFFGLWLIQGLAVGYLLNRVNTLRSDNSNLSSQLSQAQQTTSTDSSNSGTSQQLQSCINNARSLNAIDPMEMNGSSLQAQVNACEDEYGQ